MSLTDDLSDGFFRKVRRMCDALGCAPLDMLQVWFSESIGIYADAANPKGAYGINQMTKGTLRGNGWTATPEEYLALTAEQQLPFVEKCYTPYKGRLRSAARIYQVNYLPISFGDATAPDTVVASKDDPDPRVAEAYRQNTVLDTSVPKKGYVTLDDLRVAVERAVGSTAKAKAGGGTLKERWKEITDRLAKVPAAAAVVVPANLIGEWAVTTPDGSYRYVFDYDGDVQWARADQPTVIDETAGEWAVEGTRLKVTWRHSVEFWDLPLDKAKQAGTSKRDDGFQGPVSAKKVK
jgi:hypothetical protein